MRYRPISPRALVQELADAIAAADTSGGREPAGRWVRVGIDGPAAAEPEPLADALAESLRERGRATLAVSSYDFLRPASVRLERGRTNPDAFYESWFDLSGLRREALEPLSATTTSTGTGRVLPRLWDQHTDRAARAPYVTLPPGAVLLLSGPLLLGAGLPLDVAVHLLVTPAALARRTPPDQRWTLPAFARYAAEVRPEQCADVVVRYDDPRHPAIGVT